MNSGQSFEGWYPTEHGLRWWTGSQWGPFAPNQLPQAPDTRTEEEKGKTLATLAHLGPFAGGFVVPLVLYLLEKDKNRFTRHHAAQALNFQITFMILWLLSFALMFIAIPLTARSGSSTAVNEAPPWPFFLVFFGLFAGMALNYVMSIVAMVNAHKGKYFRYRVALPFFK